MITVGIDEVGRGCWAGPLVAGAVILSAPIDGLRDSKKISKAERERLAAIINNEALAVGLGWIWPEEVDALGLSKSVQLAMSKALSAIGVPYEAVIIDGNINYFPEDPRARAVIKADDTVPAVSAASIVAKVARDEYMAVKAAKEYPLYGFDKHVGYGTALHIAALKEFGATPLHRMSYKPIKNFMLESDS